MDLKNLYRISVFQRVVEQGNFSRAANELRLSKSVVSQHVSELEREFKVRLLNRSTRSVSVTQEGHRLADAAGKMIHLISTAIEELEQEQQRPSGLIRITASQNFAVVYLIGAVLRFHKKHPEIEVEIDSRDSITNIIETGYDVAFRIGWLKSSELHAVKICDFEMVPCASPEHIEQFGEVKTPLDLTFRQWVSITIMSDFDRVTLTSRDHNDVTIPVNPVLRTNSGLTAKQMVIEGTCAGLLPDYAIRDELKSGRIIRLLPDWSHRPGEIAATYAHRHRMPPRLRAFLDFLKEDARVLSNN
jgi:DNA-binding transcriptional LysR family regulator